MGGIRTQLGRFGINVGPAYVSKSTRTAKGRSGGWWPSQYNTWYTVPAAPLQVVFYFYFFMQKQRIHN